MSVKPCPRIRVAGLLLQDGYVMMVKHRKGEREYWLLPGGGVECSEGLSDALRREFLEETNLRVEVKDIAFVVDSIGDRHVVNIVFHVVAGEPFELNSEGAFLELGFTPRDPRVKGVYMVHRDALMDLEIHPPINQELLEIASGGDLEVNYLGVRWKA